MYAVASGKGGVGKSSVTVNLAASLAGARPVGRRDRRGHLRALGAPHARHDRPADPGRGHDHAAAGARREGHLDRHVHRRQRRGRLARPDAAPCAAAVPGRRLLGRPRRAPARPAAGHRRHRDLARPAAAERRDPGRDHPADGRRRGGRAGRGDRAADPPAPGRRGREHVVAGAADRGTDGDLRQRRRRDRRRVAHPDRRSLGAAAGSDPARHPGPRVRRRRHARSCSRTRPRRRRSALSAVADRLATRRESLAGKPLGLRPPAQLRWHAESSGRVDVERVRRRALGGAAGSERSAVGAVRAAPACAGCRRRARLAAARREHR